MVRILRGLTMNARHLNCGYCKWVIGASSKTPRKCSKQENKDTHFCSESEICKEVFEYTEWYHDPKTLELKEVDKLDQKKVAF